MKSKEQETKPQRNPCTSQFKEQTLERARKDGAPKVAKDLGLAPARPAFLSRSGSRGRPR